MSFQKVLVLALLVISTCYAQICDKSLMKDYCAQAKGSDECEQTRLRSRFCKYDETSSSCTVSKFAADGLVSARFFEGEAFEDNFDSFVQIMEHGVCYNIPNESSRISGRSWRNIISNVLVKPVYAKLSLYDKLSCKGNLFSVGFMDHAQIPIRFNNRTKSAIAFC